jgi:RNA polymerase sigma-70 factor (ECF subfamily)
MTGEGAPLDLVGRAQGGEREAFDMLVERHITEVYRLAMAIVGPMEARDLTQDAFVQAWVKLPTLRNPDAFAPWLRRICANTARNWLRAQRRRGQPASIEADAALADTMADRHPDFRLDVETRSVLQPAFERLSPDQRAVLALHYSMGYSIRESADALGVGIGTAKSRLNAALNVLRTAIGAAEADAALEVAR